MSIAEFIRESMLRPRLKQSNCLAVYDADSVIGSSALPWVLRSCASSTKLVDLEA